MSLRASRTLFRAFLILVPGVLASCSYTWRRPTPPEALRVYVPLADNTSGRAGLEALLTSRIRERLARHGSYRLVTSPEESERTLLVQISKWARERGPSLVTGSEASSKAGGVGNRQVTAGDFLLNAVVDVEWVENLPGLRRQIWKKSFSRSQIFEASRRFDSAATSANAPLVNDSREEVLAGPLVDAIVVLIEDNL